MPIKSSGAPGEPRFLKSLSVGPGTSDRLEGAEEAKEMSDAESGFEEEAAYPAFGKEMNCGQEPKGRAELASGVWTVLASRTYRWGLAPVICWPSDSEREHPAAIHPRTR